jgi:hypothetical protein
LEAGDLCNLNVDLKLHLRPGRLALHSRSSHNAMKGAAAAAAAAAEPRPPWTLWALCAALVAVRSLDQVLFYRISVIMQEYTWFFSSVVYPVSYCVAITPIVAIQWWRGKVAGASLRFPLRVLFAFALFDQAANLLSTWPQAYIGGSATNVLSQLMLPANIVLARLFVGTRFRWTHIAGAALAVLAGVATVAPDLLSSGGGGGGASATGGTYALWAAVMVLSALPNAGGNVYKEGWLKREPELDVWFANWVESVFQILLAVVTVPLVALPFAQGSVPLAQLPRYLSAAHACAMAASGAEPQCSSDVMPAAAWMAVYIWLNLAFSALMLVVFRRGSSVLFSVASVARLPVVDVLLLSPAIAGPGASVPGWADALAATLAVLGLALYQLRAEIPPLEAQKEETKGGAGADAEGADANAGDGGDSPESETLLIKGGKE